MPGTAPHEIIGGHRLDVRTLVTTVTEQIPGLRLRPQPAGPASCRIGPGAGYRRGRGGGAGPRPAADEPHALRAG